MGVAPRPHLASCESRYQPWSDVFVPSFSVANGIQQAIDDLTADRAGPIAVLVQPVNTPSLTLDSAIYKGGTNIAESGDWGTSRFVASLVPDRTYFYQGPIGLGPFQYLLFVAPGTHGQIDRVQDQLSSTFGIWLQASNARCR